MTARRAPELAVLGAAVVGFATVGVLVIGHIRDFYGLDGVSAAWLSLTHSAGHDTIYPAVFDGTRWGGVRYLPGPVLLTAVLARVFGDEIVAGKLLNAIWMTAVIVLVVVILRRRGASWPLALGLSSLLLVSQLGQQAALDVRHDALPVALQLGALLVASRASPRAGWAAGALCGLGQLSKLSAVWAPITLVVWWWTRSRRSLVQAAVAFAIVVTAGVAITELLSHGRFLANLPDVVFTGDSITHGARAGWPRLVREASRLAKVLALVLAAAWLAARGWRRSADPTPYPIALGVAGLVVLVLFTDNGVFGNHLLDVFVLGVIVVGDAITRARLSVRWESIGHVVLAVAILYSARAQLRHDVPHALSHPFAAPPARPLATIVGPDTKLLAEEPTVDYRLGRAPVILDTYLTRQVLQKHRDQQTDLVARIQAHEFDVVTFNEDPTADPNRFRDVTFSTPVVDEILRSYRLLGVVDGYWVYVPRA